MDTAKHKAQLILELISHADFSVHAERSALFRTSQNLVADIKNVIENASSPEVDGIDRSHVLDQLCQLQSNIEQYLGFQQLH